MARVSAHGSIVGTVEYLASAKRYMSDGIVLRNTGFGWKLHGRVKAGLAPSVAYANAQRRLDEKLATHPALAAYRAALHDMAGLNKRWRLHAAVTRNPHDDDGVWADCCDGSYDAVKATSSEVAALCSAFRAAGWQAVDEMPVAA